MSTATTHAALAARYDIAYAVWREQEEFLDQLRAAINTGAPPSMIDEDEFHRANSRFDDQVIIAGELRTQLAALAEARHRHLFAPTELAVDLPNPQPPEHAPAEPSARGVFDQMNG